MKLLLLLLVCVVSVTFARYHRYHRYRHRYHRYRLRSRTRRICGELSTFTPNFCRYSAALKYCHKKCRSYNFNCRSLKCGQRTGRRKYGRVTTKRIVGGTKSLPGAWPWHVSMRINGTQWCSGSILSKHFVLTAAHCFDPVYTSIKAEDWEIYAGDHLLSSEDRREQRVGVHKIIKHPDYNFSIHGNAAKSWILLKNDIAILQLKNAIRLRHPDKSHVCLPDDDRKIPSVYECNIVGWGHTSFNGTQPEELQEAKVLTVPNSVCNVPIAYNNTIDPNEMLCAGYEKGGVDACNYDSGGSMVCNVQGTWYATGIVSSGFECARPHSYGLYTNVPKYKKWIIESILTQAD